MGEKERPLEERRFERARMFAFAILAIMIGLYVIIQLYAYFSGTRSLLVIF